MCRLSDTDCFVFVRNCCLYSSFGPRGPKSATEADPSDISMCPPFSILSPAQVFALPNPITCYPGITSKRVCSFSTFFCILLLCVRWVWRMMHLISSGQSRLNSAFQYKLCSGLPVFTFLKSYILSYRTKDWKLCRLKYCGRTCCMTWAWSLMSTPRPSSVQHIMAACLFSCKIVYNLLMNSVIGFFFLIALHLVIKKYYYIFRSKL